MAELKTRKQMRTTYNDMMRRCFNKNHPCYGRYGGRGILVCDRWVESVENFIADMGYPDVSLTLDRIDNNLGYCKENCRWATNEEQQLNRENNVVVEFRGKSIVLSQLCRELGVSRELVSSRLGRGWSVDRAVSEPPKQIVKLSDRDATEICKRIACGEKPSQIHKDYGISLSMACFIAAGKSHAGAGPVTKRRVFRLDKSVAIAVMDDVSSGLTNRQISQKRGIGMGTVSAIKTGKHWTATSSS